MRLTATLKGPFIFPILGLPEEGRYEAEVIDTWEMTVESLGTFEGQEPIELPGKPSLALQIRPVE